MQTDLVARERLASVCSAANCGSDPRCLDAGVCADAGCLASGTCPDTGAPDAGACLDGFVLEAGACRELALCSARACTATLSRTSTCNGTGALLALGDGCESPERNPSFRFALCSKQGLVTRGPLQVTGDVSVDANEVSFGGEVKIAGSLRYAGTDPSTSNAATIIDARSLERSQPNCGRDGSGVFDAAAVVRAHAADNDNARAPSGFAGLANFAGDITLNLPCGRYFVSRIEGKGKLTLHALGNVALFVNDEVTLENGLVVDAVAGARFALVVNGSLNINGGCTLGDLNSDKYLVAVGNGRQVHLGPGESTIGGALYAPSLELVSDGPLRVSGAVFVRRAQINDSLIIHHTPSASAAAVGCGN